MTTKPENKEGCSENQNAADEKAKKEELVEAKMRMMRKKNEELMRRQKEIEEDRKNADLYSEMAVKKNPENFPVVVGKDGSGQGLGRGRGLMLQKLRKETMKAKQWEAKRRENVKREEEEQKKQGSSGSNSATRFLVDDNRVDMARTSGRNEHSWGGANFNKVVNRVQREKDVSRSHRHHGSDEMVMSGKERHEYKKWREERSRIDEERKARQKKTGNWSRAWDQPKVWDATKKMWAYENNADNHSFKSARRQDVGVPDDWGSYDGKRRRHYSGQESGTCKGESRHDGKEEVAGVEDWGDTAESNITAPDKREEWEERNEAERGKEQTESNRFSEYKGDKASENRGMLQRKEWDETITARNTEGHAHLPSEKEKTTVGEVSSYQQQHSVAVSNPHHNKDGIKDSAVKEDSREKCNTTEETSESTVHDAPKPQRKLKQREKQTAAEGHDLINTDSEPASARGSKVMLEKRDLSELPEQQESLTIEKELNKHLENDVVSQQNSVFVKDGRISDELSIEGKTEESQNAFNAKDTADTHICSSDKDKVIHEDEGITDHNLVSKKAVRLPKLVSKVEKKVSFDSSESDQARGNETQDTPSEAIGDIPPTPDFLKYDHSLEWGDVEIDEESSEITEPIKW